MIPLDFLNNFSDRWYKPLVAFGIIIGTFALIIQNYNFVFLGLFLFFLGLGEWKSHYEYHVPSNAYWNPKGDLIGFKRNWSIIGMIFYILSFLFLLIFLIPHLKGFII